MPAIFERKLFRIGEGGVAITLPKAWVNYYRLKPGDTIEVVIDSDLVVRVRKQDQDPKAERTA